MNANIPAIRLLLDDGTDLTARVNPRLLSLTLTEKRGGEADQLEITLHNTDGLLAAPNPGRYLTLWLGWLSSAEVQPGLVPKGRFKVDEVEESGPPDQVKITARSADLTGTYRQRKNRMWHETTLGAVLDEIAAGNGSTAQVHPDLASKPIEALEQHGKSDMAMVQDLGRRFDAVATWKDRRLVFMPHGSPTTANGKKIPARILTRREGWSWTCTRADRAEATGAQAEWYDAQAGHRRRVEAGPGPHHRLKHVYASEAEAKQAAESASKAGARGTWSFDYELALADCTLQPNTRVTLIGWSTRIDARKWLIAEVETSSGPEGLKQKLKLESG
jgi:phage protein D